MASSYVGGPTFPPIVEMIDAGIKTGLGTDGPTGRITNFDMFKEINVGMMLQRIRLQNRYVMPPGKLLEMATIDAAKVVHMEKEIGSLEKGKKADIILIDMFKPHLVPIYMIPYRLTYETQGQDVDTVIVDGKILMEKREVKTVDEKDVLERAQIEAETVIEKCGLHPWLDLAKNFWGQSRY
jgi:cytosine/adenosine deaminase-related metal-dependent hydrolase